MTFENRKDRTAIVVEYSNVVFLDIDDLIMPQEESFLPFPMDQMFRRFPRRRLGPRIILPEPSDYPLIELDVE